MSFANKVHCSQVVRLIPVPQPQLDLKRAWCCEPALFVWHGTLIQVQKVACFDIIKTTSTSCQYYS
jgi:hypothetical protein